MEEGVVAGDESPDKELSEAYSDRVLEPELSPAIDPATEVELLRRRLADTPRRVRQLEERLLETKGQLAQESAKNERLSSTLREARRISPRCARKLTNFLNHLRPMESWSAKTRMELPTFSLVVGKCG